MNLRIKPASLLEGSIRAFPSKSYSIRAFFVAALGGRSIVVSASDSDDATIARKISASFGAKIKKAGRNTWLVKGIQKNIKFPYKINVKESATSLRFLLSLAALTNKNNDIAVVGEGTLSSRPNKPLLEVLRKSGAKIKGSGRNESVPIFTRPAKVEAENIRIDGKLSSQFISSLLISLPLLDSKSSLQITGNYIVSQPYIEMTLSVLRTAGIEIARKGQRHFIIPGRQEFKGLKRFVVPPDYGLAAFIMAAGILCKSDIIIKGIGKDKLIQADKKILDILKKMGAKLKFCAHNLTIKGPQNLKGAQLNLRDSPDLVPITAILALFAKGKTRIYGIAHVRAKESDRISDLRKELQKVGANVRESRDELVICPTEKLKGGAILDPHDDHRLAMAFSVLGLKLGLSVKHIECINKSYPNFLSDLKALKAQIVT